MTSTPSVAQNLKTALGLMERASIAGARMLFLPEAADFIAPAADVPKLSKPVHSENNEFVQTLREEAKKLGLWLNVCIHETPDTSDKDAEKKCHNTNLVISGGGDILATYRKTAHSNPEVHLFDVDLAPEGPTIKESNTTVAGTAPAEPVPATPVGTLGLQTCFDLRFSDAAHGLLSKGCTALTYPSAFAPHTGAAHWEALLRGRAIEGESTTDLQLYFRSTITFQASVMCLRVRKRGSTTLDESRMGTQ
ncbi:Carbon-nitrogen hydrolase [Tulasnella sp. 425]|nr:Carbon-nitrogen hydrolase [Tulasnella sp. 425]